MPSPVQGALRSRAIAWLVVLGILASATHAVHAHGPDPFAPLAVVSTGQDAPESAATLESDCGLCRSRGDERELGVRAATRSAAVSAVTLRISYAVPTAASVRLAQAGPARAPPIA